MTGAIVRTALALAIAAGALAACYTTPAERQAAEQAAAEREREMAQQCARMGWRYLSGTCVNPAGGSP